MNQIEWRFFFVVPLPLLLLLLLLSSNNLLINQMRPNMIIIMTLRFDGCFVFFFLFLLQRSMSVKIPNYERLLFSRLWSFDLPNINRMYHISMLASQYQIWCAIILNVHMLPMSNIISIDSIRLCRRFHFHWIEFRFCFFFFHLIFRCFCSNKISDLSKKKNRYRRQIHTNRKLNRKTN